MRATLAAVAVVASFAPSRATAQAAGAPPAPRAVAQAIGPIIAPADARRADAPAAAVAVRPVGLYRFGWRHAAGLPSELTVADSAGQLIARYRLGDDRAAHPMTVTVRDTDLLLHAETPSGRLTVRLDDQNGTSAAGPMTGRWWLGDARGTLRGRSQ